MAKNLVQYLVYLLDKGRGPRWQQVYLSPLRQHCLLCGHDLSQEPIYERYRVCPNCRFHYSLTARNRIELLVDEGSFRETNHSIISLDPLSFSSRRGRSYKKRLSEDQDRTGLTEAVVTGRCRIGGEKAVIAVLDFGFMGGSMGSVVGEKIALAFELAHKKELPMIAIVTGGGARIQEGVLSLMQMAKTVSAANRMQEKAVPFITVLANPSTGEAYASFANLADVIIAEPNALMGLVPIRTLKEMSKHPLPSDAHTAEAHLRNGLVDLLVDREYLHEYLGALLRVLKPERDHTLNKKRSNSMPLELPAYEGVSEAIELARHPLRPTARDYTEGILDDFTELHGDRASNDDPAIVAGLGSLEGESVMVVGQQRPVATPRDGDGHMFPEGFRKARRFMSLAAKFHLPLITFIDTRGAYPGLEAEEQGIGNSIASTLSLMADLPTPIIAVIIGEGGSEGALAMSVADRILMQENAIFSPMSPERAAARLYGDSAKVREATRVLKLTSQDCLELEIVDGVVPEPSGGAHTDLEASKGFLKRALQRELGYLVNRSTKKLVKERRKKFRRMGEFSTYFKEALQQEITLLQNILLSGLRRRRAKKQPAEEVEEPSGQAAASTEGDS